MLKRFTIRADGPDGRVDHFYADTDLSELVVVPEAALAQVERDYDEATQELATELSEERIRCQAAEQKLVEAAESGNIWLAEKQAAEQTISSLREALEKISVESGKARAGVLARAALAGTER